MTYKRLGVGVPSLFIREIECFFCCRKIPWQNKSDYVIITAVVSMQNHKDFFNFIEGDVSY